MLFKPMLIPTFSGIMDTDKKTCIIFYNEKYASILENCYRPHVMCCMGEEITFLQMSTIILEKSFLTLEETIKLYEDKYNVIVHTDNEELLKELISNDIYYMRNKSVALSTGLIKEWLNVKMLYQYVQEILGKTKKTKKVLIEMDESELKNIKTEFKIIDNNYTLTTKLKENISYFNELNDYERFQIREFVEKMIKDKQKGFEINIHLGRSPFNDMRTYELSDMKIDNSINAEYKTKDFC